MVFDAHVKLGRHFTGYEAAPDAYVEQMKRYGIDSAVVCPLKPPGYSAQRANDYVAAIDSARDGKILLRAFRVDPWNREEFLAEAGARSADKHFIAAYMDPWEDSFRCNDERVFYAYGHLEKMDLPLIIETGYPWVSHISQLWEIARMFPKLRILATNAGQLDLSGLTFGNVQTVLAESPNIYLGTSAAVGADWLKNAAEGWARGRVLFTSSYPAFEPEIERFRIDHGYMGEAAKRDIYSSNAAAFFGI